MNSRLRYGQDLRAVGQALEAKNINVFELKQAEQVYLVRAGAERPVSFFSSLLAWRGRRRQGARSSPLHYAPPEIERLDRDGRSKRVRPGRLPDFYSLPNTLRTVGYYLDARGARLLEIHKSPLNVMILYHDRDGHPGVEERTVASFYDLFIRLHGTRRKTEAV